jgi:hypothetical protein
MYLLPASLVAYGWMAEKQVHAILYWILFYLGLLDVSFFQ